MLAQDEQPFDDTVITNDTAVKVEGDEALRAVSHRPVKIDRADITID